MGLCVCPRSWLRGAPLKCFSDVSSGPGAARHGAHLGRAGLSGVVPCFHSESKSDLETYFALLKMDIIDRLWGWQTILSLPLAPSPSVCLPLSPSLSFCVCLSLCLLPSLPLSLPTLSHYVCVSVSVCLPLSLSVSVSVSPSSFSSPLSSPLSDL